MHIPDGFLSTPVWAVASAISVPGVAYFARTSRGALLDGKIPLMGVMGAFVFAAQMINFPVGIGTSGHLVGSALLAITLGPAAACVVMTAILTVQALLFQDGGVLALGANVFNMALAGVLAGYLPYKYWGSSARPAVAIFASGFLAVFVAASLAMVELLLSGVTMPPGVALLSLALFAVSSAIEGVITLAAVRALKNLNTSWIQTPQPEGNRGLGAVLVAAVLLATIGAMAASSLPDGLEKLAEGLGITARAQVLVQTPLADYRAQFLQSEWMGKAAAGLLGLGAVLAACLLLGRAVSRRSA